MVQAQLMGRAQDNLAEVAALDALSPHQLQGTVSGELGAGAGLVEELIALGVQQHRPSHHADLPKRDDLRLTLFDRSPLPPDLWHQPHDYSQTDPP